MTAAIYPWSCLEPTCDASGLTTASQNDVTGAAAKHVRETHHAIVMKGWVEDE